MADETKVEELKPKFAPGQLVKHPLGMKCMVTAFYDARKDEATGEDVKLPTLIYDLEFLDKNGCLQRTRIAEPFICV